MHLARSLAFAVMLVAASFWTGASAAPAFRSVSISIRSHGVRLTLIVPRRAYPADALVRITLRVSNVSHHPMLVTNFPHWCAEDNPGAEVLDAGGQVVYPPALIPPAYPTCPPPPPPPNGMVAPNLLPGATLQRPLLVILRRDSLRATLQLVTRCTPAACDLSGPPVTVVTRPLILQLIPAQRPEVDLSTTAPIHAVLHPPSGASGPLYYQQAWSCHPSGLNGQPWAAASGPLDWNQQSSSVLTPDFDPNCVSDWSWHAVAGWIGYSVATFQYGSQFPMRW